MTSPLKLCVRRSEVSAPSGKSVEISLRVPSEVSCIEEAVELVSRHCFSGHPTSSRLRFKLRVILSEALANAIICGNGEDCSKTVDVVARSQVDCLELEVSDNGCGFDPASIPEPVGPEELENACGRGLFLIRNLADQVRFNDRGNTICMTLSRH